MGTIQTQTRRNKTMARQIRITPTKTYKTLATMEKAVSNVPEVDQNNERFRYLVCQTAEGRYYPVFVGRSSLDLVHSDFCVVG